MRDILGWVSAAEEATVLATGLANAGYFLARAGTRPPRRVAALLLAGLYGGTALLALVLLSGGLDDDPRGIALRAPLVVGNVGTLALVALGRGR